MVRLLLMVLTSVTVLTPDVWAQQASGIAGVVKDTSSGVLPGVTVEAASPALIEKVRTVVSDTQGRYNIVDLRPGTYTVTFTLAGFSTFRREGVVLTAGFTGTVNADLQVGALEETITVTGAAPLVDTQNVRQQKVVSAELLASLPSGMKALTSTLVTLVPGISGTTDVGGSSGLYRSNGGSGGLFFHGKSDITVLYDGMGASASGPAVFYMMNAATAQETTVETSGGSAQSNATLVMNMIPKEGGNLFSFDASGTYTNQHLQSDNLDDALRARGVAQASKVLLFYDSNVTVGGPIKRDRLWFFTAGRRTRNKNAVPGVYFNKTQGTPFYTADLDRPAYRTEWLTSLGGRVTWQVSPKHKVSGFADTQKFYDRGRGEFASPEAYTHFYNFWPQGLYSVSWSSPRTNKLLLEAGVAFTKGTIPYPSPGDGVYQVKPEDIYILELSTNFPYNAKSFYANVADYDRLAQRYSVSYVTGSHAFRGGVQLEMGFNTFDREVHGDVNYIFNKRVPNTITQFATPYLQENRFRELGLFVQDQWTVKRLTLNYGLRFDALNGHIPAQHVPAGRFIPFARDFAPVDDTPALTDLNPRLGASYDLFGTGRTALKVSLGRYVETNGLTLVSANNPITLSLTQVNRSWNDANLNYVPDCDLTNFAANGECAQIADSNFGKNNPKATRYADQVLRGFGNRNFSWDFGTEVQHQLRPGLSVTGGYYRNWSGNFRVTDNLAVAPADHDPYCITAPVDARLPGGGGYPVCGLYDVAPAKFGKVDNLVRQASNYYGKEDGVTCANAGTVASDTASRSGGSACGISDFFGVSFNTRFGSGIQLSGGVDTGRTIVDNCFVVDSPQQRLNCRTVKPFKSQTQIKAFGSYPLPGDIIVSGTFQNNSGRPFEADYPAPNATIAPSLGRNLAACGTAAVCTQTATVPLVAPYTLFMDRRVQLDLRLSKVLKLGPKARLRANLDLYNALNSNTVLAVNSRYGPTWQQPAATLNVEVDSILPGRLLHVGGQLSF